MVDLPDAKKRELKLQHGVQVEAVDGAAARAGVMEGDVILDVAGKPVNSIADVRQGIDAVRQDGRSRVLMRVQSSGGGLQFVAVPIIKS